MLHLLGNLIFQSPVSNLPIVNLTCLGLTLTCDVNGDHDMTFYDNLQSTHVISKTKGPVLFVRFTEFRYIVGVIFIDGSSGKYSLRYERSFRCNRYSGS